MKKNNKNKSVKGIMKKTGFSKPLSTTLYGFFKRVDKIVKKHGLKKRVTLTKSSHRKEDMWLGIKIYKRVRVNNYPFPLFAGPPCLSLVMLLREPDKDKLIIMQNYFSGFYKALVDSFYFELVKSGLVSFSLRHHPKEVKVPGTKDKFCWFPLYKRDYHVLS